MEGGTRKSWRWLTKLILKKFRVSIPAEQLHLRYFIYYQDGVNSLIKENRPNRNRLCLLNFYKKKNLILI